MTPTVLKLWAQLVVAVPNARLLIKAKPFACPNMRSARCGRRHLRTSRALRVSGAVYAASPPAIGSHAVFRVSGARRAPSPAGTSSSTGRTITTPSRPPLDPC
eukprot:8996954-Pyramimonas_sp.AAC.1